MKSSKAVAPKAAKPKGVPSTSAAPKPATPKSAAPKVEPELRILKVASCPSLSGKSTLTYHVGCNDKSEVQFRVYANSGGGFFNGEWIALSAIQETLKKSSQITSFSLRSLYAGKSTNSPGFLLALLKAEGLVQIKGDKERVYVAIVADAFIAEVKALMASGVSLKDDDRAAKAEPQKAKPSKVQAKVDAKAQAKVAEKSEAKPQEVNAKSKATKEPSAPSKKATSKAPKK